jgi:ethanolamine transporter EutH
MPTGGFSTLLFKQVLMIIICVFFVLGMLDHYFGNRFGLGQEFKNAFMFTATSSSAWLA